LTDCPAASTPGSRSSANQSAPPGLYGFGKVQVATLTDDGREVRPRALEVNQLHDSGTTKTGQPRRTGYRLVEER
jgi:hypothetical protein